MEYGPIGQQVRWHDDIRRDGTWTILPTYTSDGYVPCTGIKRGLIQMVKPVSFPGSQRSHPRSAKLLDTLLNVFL